MVAGRRLVWRGLFRLPLLSLPLSYISLTQSILSSSVSSSSLSLCLLLFFPPMFSLRSPPPLLSLSGDVTLNILRLENINTHIFTLSHLENLKSPPKNMTTETKRRREKEEYSLRWERHWKDRRGEALGRGAEEGRLVNCLFWLASSWRLWNAAHLKVSKLLSHTRLVCPQ